MTTRDLNSLRGPARTVREETQRLKQAQEEYDAARVLIDTQNGHRRWSTVGASANIIEASWRALADSVEYGLMVA